MAFGLTSKVFIAFITDSFNRTEPFDLNSDTFNIMLYKDTGTPDNTVSSANSAWNAGAWATGNEATAAGWTTGGLALASVTSTSTGNVYTFRAADRTGGATDTIADTRGCLIFDNTVTTPVAKQGVCYLSFGGLQSVAGAPLTVVFNAATGILQVTAT